jgi:voltage-gated potassium channel
MTASISQFLRNAFEDERTPLYHKVNDILALIILISVVLVVAESVESLRRPYQGFFRISEWIIVGIFTVEYIIYIYLAKNKFAYLFSVLGIIDFLAIMPTYLELLAPLVFGGFADIRVLRVLRVIRLLRLFRVLKLIRYNYRSHIEVKKEIFRDTDWNNLEIYLFAVTSVIILSGTLVYIAERKVAQTPFVDIPTGMWWAVVTLTTVGYGDIVPVTFWGKVVAGITMFMGLALFALLLSVVGRTLQNLLFGGPVDSEDSDTEKR